MFKDSDKRGLAIFLPLVAIIVILLTLAKPHNGMRSVAEQRRDTSEKVRDTLFLFDPNTATFEELVMLGLPKTAAASVLKYRARGKVFGIREEFAACYGISDSLYERLKPYIAIADEYAVRPLPNRTVRERKGRREIHREPFRIDTVTVAYLQTIGFSHRRAEAFIRYRDMRGGLRNIEEVRECYVIGDEECDTLAAYIIFPKCETETDAGNGDERIELNGADSAALRSVYGIGAKSVVEIMEYRRKLGGFYEIGQLAEVKSVTESNFEKISAQIYCDSCNISKIDINFARPQDMAGHPYISDRALRKLLKTRQLKGGWSTIEEMVKDKIFTRDEAEKIRPYLRFTRESR